MTLAERFLHLLRSEPSGPSSLQDKPKLRHSERLKVRKLGERAARRKAEQKWARRTEGEAEKWRLAEELALLGDSSLSEEMERKWYGPSGLNSLREQAGGPHV